MQRKKNARKWLRKYVGGDELMSGTHRWCLWLKDITPQELKAMPLVMERVGRVREARLQSPTKSVRDFALSSAMHVAWVRTVSGRLKSDYSYAPAVYNNFPWPRDPEAVTVKRIEKAAQHVLDVRKDFASSSLAELYDPLSMPPELSRAHEILDRCGRCLRKADVQIRRRPGVASLRRPNVRLLQPEVGGFE